MSLAATTVWEVRTTGNDSNGGGFDPALGGTDYSVFDNPIATGTVTSASATVTATTGIFTSAMVGNLITDGTTWKEITGFTSSTIVTVDTAPSWTSVAIKVGGAVASPGIPGGKAVNGNLIYIKAGTYNMSASANVANGRFNSAATSASNVPFQVIGYSTNRTILNNDTAPVFNPSANSVTCFTFTSGNILVRNLDCEQPGAFTSCLGFSFQSSPQYCQKLTAGGSLTKGFDVQSPGVFMDGCLTNLSAGVGTGFGLNGSDSINNCVALNGLTGFDTGTTANCTLIHCLAANQSGTNAGGFKNLSGNNNTLINCVAYHVTGTGAIGFHGLSSNYAQNLINCVATDCATYGFSGGATPRITSNLINCAGYNNTTANFDAAYATAAINNIGFIALSASPWTLPGSLNFTLNSTTGGGASLKAAGYPSSFPGLLGTNYPDIGSFQTNGAVIPGGAAGGRIFTGM